MRNSRNIAIDIFKFIAAVMIVAIHCSLFSDINETLNFAFCHVLFRLAVPFFAVCSGYYLADRLSFTNDRCEKTVRNKKVVFTFLIRNLKLYIVWSVIYLVILIPNWIDSGWFSAWAFVDWGIAFITSASYYHLWYLLFLVYAFVGMWLVLRMVSLSKLPIVIIGLYALEALTYGYRWCLSEWLQDIVAVGDKVSAIHAVTRIMPFLLLGVFIKRKQRKFQIKGTVIIFIFCIAALAVEANLLKMKGQSGVSYIFFTLPTVYSLFVLLEKIRVKNITFESKIVAETSIYIYLIHPFFIKILEKWSVSNSIIRFVFVTVVSIIFGMGCCRVKQRRIPT